MHGGTRYSRLVTRVAAPRWISTSSSELPPSVSTSTDHAIAPMSSGCSVDRLRFEQRERQRHRERGDELHAARAAHVARRDEALLVQRADGDAGQREQRQRQVQRAQLAGAELAPDDQQQAGEAEQQPEPLLGTDAMLSHCAVADTHTAVSTGCSPTIKATVPAPMPAFTAAQTPPR